jgi:alpha-beta hydrolase superfamily lysophospholipase
VQVQADEEGRDNRVVVYCSTTTAISDTLHAKAFDKDGREMGRASVPVSLAAGGADHLVLQFQALTELERKCRIVIE